jgi:hypothetical protein
MRGRVLAAARAAGRDGEVTCALNLEVQVDEHPDADPSVLAGPPAVVAECLTGFVRAGFTAFNFNPAGRPHDEQNERLAREVLPTVRADVYAG